MTTSQRLSTVPADLIAPDDLRKALNDDKQWIRWRTRIEGVGIPTRYKAARLEDFGENHSCLLGKSLYLVGGTGAGKTHLMSALAHRQVALGLNEGISPDRAYARFTTVPNLIARVKRTFGRDSQETEEEVFDTYANACWLYIDDFGTESVTDWSFEMLYRIVDHRWCEMLPTIVSSNIELNDIAGQYSERIASRIAGMGDQVVLNSGDRRCER